MLLKSGPFVNQSVLKYERKHKPFKAQAQTINNFKNLSKSMAVRHQINEFKTWRKEFSEKRYEFPGSRVCRFAEISFPQNFDASEFRKYHQLLCANNAILRGTKYKINDVLIVSLNELDSLPVFGCVKNIIVVDHDVHFVCLPVKINGYVSHSRTYNVTKDFVSSAFSVKYKNLFDFHPLALHKCFMTNCYFDHIVLRHKLMFNNFAEDFENYIS